MEITDHIDAIEREFKEQDAIYHGAAVKFGLTDTTLWLLYELYFSEGGLTQQELCLRCAFPKQTVHSAIQNLVKGGYASLEPLPASRNAKLVRLTPKGDARACRSAVMLREAELRAYERMPEGELQTLQMLLSKLNGLLRTETMTI